MGPIDALIYQQHRIPAVKAYRERFGVKLPEAVKAIEQRETVLRHRAPERFKISVDQTNVTTS